MTLPERARDQPLSFGVILHRVNRPQADDRDKGEECFGVRRDRTRTARSSVPTTLYLLP